MVSLRPTVRASALLLLLAVSATASVPLALASGSARSEGIAAGDGEWSRIPPGEHWEHVAVFDPVRNRMLVTTGITRDGIGIETEVLAMELAGDPIWSVLPTIGGPPPLRHGASAIYDPNGDRLVLFGGFGGVYLNDVWSLDLATNTWTQIVPVGGPPSIRGFHTAIYDALNKQMVVFAGFNFGGNLGDVWTLSLTGPPTWLLLPTLGGPPSVRSSHGAVYDPAGRMLVFGGSDPAPLGDAWELRLPTAGTGSWNLLATSGTPPSARYAHAAVYDAPNRRMIVFAGGYPQLNDVYELSMPTLTWSVLLPSPSSQVGLPDRRYYQPAIFDEGNARMVVHGGSSSSSILSDTWALSLSGPPQWRVLSPPNRRGHAAAYDLVNDQMVLFGGTSPTGLQRDVWAFDLMGASQWRQIIPVPPLPPPREFHTLTFDKGNDRFILFGGSDGTAFNDVWELSLAGPSWTQLFPLGGPPPARLGHTAVVNGAGTRMLMFGGIDNGGIPLNDVWELSLVGPPTWSLVVPAGAPPPPRGGHVAVLDPVHWLDPSSGHMAVFGGFNGAVLDDTWDLVLDGGPTWQPFPAGPPPAARLLAHAVYDRARDRLLLFGGETAGGLVNDLWELPFWGSKRWSEQFPLGAFLISREAGSAVYDVSSDRMVVFGGENGSEYLGDLWQLDLTAVSVGVDHEHVADFRALPVFPNPSRAGVRIGFELPVAADVEVGVFDLAGRQIATIRGSRFNPGHHELGWDGRDASAHRAPPGVYLARLRVGPETRVLRFALIR